MSSSSSPASPRHDHASLPLWGRQSSRTPLLAPAQLQSPPANPQADEDLSMPSSPVPYGSRDFSGSPGTGSGSGSDGADGRGSRRNSPTREEATGGLTPLDQTLESIGMGRYQYQLLVLCGLGWAADNMWLQGVAVILPRVQEHFGIADRWIGLLSTSIFAGMMVGAWGWGSYSDVRGRVAAFNLTLLLTSVFGLASAFAPNFGTLCFALFWLGTGVGGSMPTDGTLFLENVPKTRHYLLTALSVFFSLGAIFTSLLSLAILPRFSCPSHPKDSSDPVAPACDVRHDNQGWRYLLGCLGLISATMFLSRVLFFRLHESAKFLVSANRPSAAVSSLRRISRFNGNDAHWELDDVVDHHQGSQGVPLRTAEEDVGADGRIGKQEEGNDGDEPPAVSFSTPVSADDASLALPEVPSSPSFLAAPPCSPPRRHKRRSRPAWVDRLPRSLRTTADDYLERVGELLDEEWRTTTLLIWAMWTLASAGFTIFNVFLPKFLEAKLANGGSGSDSRAQTLRDYVLYTISGLPGAILGAYLVETSWGRTKTLAYSTFATALGTCAFVFVEGQAGVVASSMLVSLAATLMYAVIYSLTPEVFPTALRGTASGIASALSRLSGIVAPLLTGFLLSLNVSLPLFLSAACFFATAACAWGLRAAEEVLIRGTGGMPLHH
ncbi:hypothetical protein JCM21900_005777 [Sporobolomyces salmonicolor]